MSEKNLNLLSSEAADPLFNTPVFLSIGDINKLTFLDDKKVFQFGSHFITKIKIFGFVVSLKETGESFESFLDDGTGEIKCYLKMHKSKIYSNEINQSLSNFNLKHLNLFLKQDTNIQLGDLVVAIGWINKSSKGQSFYISSQKWESIKEFKKDDLWLSFLEKRIKLYKNVYKHSSELDIIVLEAKRSVLMQQFYVLLVDRLKLLFQSLFNGEQFEGVNNFFGYELFEMEPIKVCLEDCKKLFSDDLVMKKTDYKNVFVSSLSCVLNLSTISGNLLEKKDFAYQRVVKEDKINFQYFVTLKYKSLMDKIMPYVVQMKRDKNITIEEMQETLVDTFPILENEHSIAALSLLADNLSKKI